MEDRKMQAVQRQAYEAGTVLYMAMELSNSKWKLGFSNGQRIRRKSIEARDRFGLVKEVELARYQLGLEREAHVMVCFEAGRGRKHVKTDRIDVEKLLDLLMRYANGYRRAFSVVRVPSREAEAGQRLHREDEYVLRQRGDSTVAIKRRRLECMKSVGPKTSRVLSAEVFSWREFRNGKQVGGMSGLTPTPSHSGDVRREQGISKAGNRRVRRVMIELAWLWLQWQPDSALSQWFMRRFAQGGKRMRRVGIVALARKLLIALWRYVEWGVIPQGAVLKAV
jgi:transposase